MNHPWRTGAWAENRRDSSDFQYAAELVDILIQKGVSGTVEKSAVKALEYELGEKDKEYLVHMINVSEKR